MEVNYLTPEDLAKILKINIESVQRQARNGKLPAIKIAGKYRFNEEKIFKYIEKKFKNSYSD